MNAVDRGRNKSSSGASVTTNNEERAGTRTGTKEVAGRYHGQRRSDRLPTKIKLPDAENSWKLLLRDIIAAFIPLFVLFMISTHPMVSNIGHRDPNAATKYSGADLLTVLSLKKQQEDLQWERLFLEAMNERKCYHFPTIDVSTEMKQRKGRRRRKFKGQNKPQSKTKMKKAQGWNKRRPRFPQPSSSNSAPPWSSRMVAVFQGNPPFDSRVSKGTEAAKQISHEENRQGGKKGGRKRARKKKFGSRF